MAGIVAGLAVGASVVVTGGHDAIDVLGALPLGVTLTLLVAAGVDRVGRAPDSAPGEGLIRGGGPRRSELSSPRMINAMPPSSLLDTAPGITSAMVPNRTILPASKPGMPQTLVVRRTITNVGPATITSLRVLITSITTYGDTTSAQAILVPISAAGETTGGYTMAATTLDSAPSGVGGGGLDSALDVTLPRRPGFGRKNQHDLDFAIIRGGSFSFGCNVEGSTA